MRKNPTGKVLYPAMMIFSGFLATDTVDLYKNICYNDSE